MGSAAVVTEPALPGESMYPDLPTGDTQVLDAPVLREHVSRFHQA